MGKIASKARAQKPIDYEVQVTKTVTVMVFVSALSAEDARQKVIDGDYTGSQELEIDLVDYNVESVKAV